LHALSNLKILNSCQRNSESGVNWQVTAVQLEDGLIVSAQLHARMEEANPTQPPIRAGRAGLARMPSLSASSPLAFVRTRRQNKVPRCKIIRYVAAASRLTWRRRARMDDRVAYHLRAGHKQERSVRCGAVRCGAVRCGAVRCGAVRVSGVA
jgi:hypothetical protein